ncbi:MAG TPA: sigma-70 family RNA polymerase sigma factor [Thermoanaerobaculia bacterium]|jgi:RNA polymerase sigma-70 factor (ECF subfamily)|nr:sigma-70 family RNA polymerase sigma factor [Thermoanaerobaculia bacterium]
MSGVEEGTGANADARDVARVLAGDPEAFAGIVRRWQGPLYQLAYRFSGEAGAAEEMAQDAFLKAYRALGHWRGDSAFSTWLFAIATNSCRSWLRRLRPPSLPIEAADGQIMAAAADPAERRERERWVRCAVDELPAHYREAVHLFYFHEMDLAAAAASLGVPEGTLKSQLHRARHLLERRLAPLLGAAGTEERVCPT